MAKPNKPTQLSPAQTSSVQPRKRQTINAFRIEKVTQYEYRAFKVILREDGTFIEEEWDRLTLPELLGRRILQFMGKEAYESFEANKKAIASQKAHEAQK